MAKPLYKLFILLIPALLFAQKNVFPVKQTNMLSIQLPEGSKQDKRLLSTAVAGSFLAMSTEFKNVEFSPVEVYTIPVASGFSFENIKNQLAANGYDVKFDNGENRLLWFTQNTKNWLVYLSQEANETNLYIGEGNLNKMIADNTAQPDFAGSLKTAEQINNVSPRKYPAFIPPLAGRQSGSSPSKQTLKEDLTVVYDLDSNRYSIIKIGENYWMKENLRTTKYRDTSNIATGLNAQDWSKTKQGAYAFYDDNPIHKLKYGLLYNGYAVASGKLCPIGWHVATDKEWNELEKFFGVPEAELERTGERGNIADKLKVSEGWNASAFTGNNTSGFSIMPAGSRNDKGEYTTLNQYGNFWTSTVYDDRYGLLYLWNHHAHYNTNAMGRIYTVAQNGYSCRCVKDKPKPVKTK
jgi:uncharacterized protein (TIGR02145 family)